MKLPTNAAEAAKEEMMNRIDESWWHRCHWADLAEIDRAIDAGAVVTDFESVGCSGWACDSTCNGHLQVEVVDPVSHNSRICTLSDSDVTQFLADANKYMAPVNKREKVRRRVRDALNKTADVRALYKCAKVLGVSLE